MLKSLTLIGSSSGRNAGDAAILSGMMDAIDKASGTRLLYEIPTYRPEFVWHSYQNRVRPVSMLPWHATAGMLGYPTAMSLLRTDGTLIFDNMLFDRKLYNPLFNYMSTLYLALPYIKKKGKLLGCYNIGAGPVGTPRGREMLRVIAELMDFIAVRDQESLDLLRDVGVTNRNITITADAALRVEPAPAARINEILANLGLANEKEVLAVNVNTYINSWADDSARPLTRDEFTTTYAKALDEVAEKIQVPFMFLCTQHHDVGITQEVMRKMNSQIKKVLFTNEEHSHYEVKGVLGRVSLLFAMRLHANILCSSALTPIISLAFQKKVTSYYKLLGLLDYALSFKDFSKEGLVNHILKGWESRDRIRAVLENRIPFLQSESDKGAHLLALISKGVSPAEAIAEIEGRGAQFGTAA